MTVVDIDRALIDQQLLGAALGDVAPWSTWRVVMKAAFGLVLNEEEARTFATIAGNRTCAAPNRHLIRLR